MFVWRRAGALRFLQASGLSNLGVTAIVSTRLDGLSGDSYSSLNPADHVGDDPRAVQANRRLLFTSLGLLGRPIVHGQQVHSTCIAIVTAAGSRHSSSGGKSGAPRLDKHSTIIHTLPEACNLVNCLPRTDGLLTSQHDTVLMGFFADCVPVFVANKDVIALAHAGWKGTLGNIAGRLVETIVEVYGIRPQDLHAAIGPAIGSCCYQVADELVRSFIAQFGPAVFPFIQKRSSGGQLDLPGLNRHLLQQAGIPPVNIESSSLCTCCNAHVLFSFRAARSQGRENTGRLAALIYRSPLRP